MKSSQEKPDIYAFPFSLNPKRSFRASLSLTLMVSGILVFQSAFAQDIGPPAPQEPPVQDNAVTKAISHWFSKSKSSNTNAQDTSASDTKKQQSTLMDPNTAIGDQIKVNDKSSEPKDSDGNNAANSKPVPTESVLHAPLLTQPPLVNAKVDTPQVDQSNPPVLNHPKLDDPANPLGFAEAESRLKKYTDLVNQKQFVSARAGLFELRQWLVELTEDHIELYKTLNQIPSARAQAELEKVLALQFAQLRDRAMVESAKIHISDKDYSHAIKELTSVVKSQPRSQLGLRSYAMLQEIGFTEQLQLAQ
jgi:hypothetical protein